MDEAIKLMIEQINSALNVIQTGMNNLDDKLTKMYDKHTEDYQCLKLEHLDLKKEFDEHKLMNGFNSDGTAKDIEGIKETIKPVQIFRAGWIMFMAFLAILGTLVYLGVQVGNLKQKVLVKQETAIVRMVEK